MMQCHPAPEVQAHSNGPLKRCLKIDAMFVGTALPSARLVNFETAAPSQDACYFFFVPMPQHDLSYGCEP